MKKINLLIAVSVVAILAIGSVWPQSGGQFQIAKSVIAGGGGQSAGGTFILDGTVAEPVSGITSTGGTFELSSGFWGAGGLAAASSFTVEGHVVTADGRGLRSATVSMTSSQGVARVTTTSSFGFFKFDNVVAGDVYTFRIISRLYRYQPQAVQVTSNLTLPDFVGLE